MMEQNDQFLDAQHIRPPTTRAPDLVCLVSDFDIRDSDITNIDIRDISYHEYRYSWNSDFRSNRSTCNVNDDEDTQQIPSKIDGEYG